MLIAFDHQVKPDETMIVYINPDYVVSVAPHLILKDQFYEVPKDGEKQLTEIDTVCLDGGMSHTWLIVGEPQHIAELIRNGMTIRK